ncbi:MAG: RagB/SusD family nutrient uptake outer membrane protein [Peptostreptococcaceae bacterium]|nr:RagB/SusD family nutrient uptake outer membrane protein [Peptostreptococcaceae bacterium]
MISFAIGVVTLIASSCSKDFLTTEAPYVTSNDYFTSELDATNALTSCYDILGWEDGTNSFQLWQGDILGHDSYKGGEGAGDQPWMEPLLKSQYSANNEGIVVPYKSYYIAINRCNTVIDRVPLMSEDILSTDKGNEIVAEAKFLRGYFYFELIKMFGQVPLVTTVLKSGEYDIPKASIEEIWNQIESDFSDAAKYLPNKSEQSTEELGRATKGAADAFRCKAYIFEKKWDEALTLANTIINSNEYALEEDYGKNWDLTNENGKESIFEIQFSKSGDGNWGDDNEGNMYVIFTRSRNDDDGWGFDCPTQKFVDQFEPGDPRLQATVIFDGEVLWGGTPDEMIADNKFSTCLDGYMCQKYQLPASERGDQSDDPNNWKVIRYSEVLLWAAEAAAHTGGDWNFYLQQVRDRAGLGHTPYTDPLEAVYHERSVELGMEGQRFWDVIREGRGEELWGVNGTIGHFGYSETQNHYFPIPQSQIDLSDGILIN